MAELSLNHLEKIYPNGVEAVEAFDLEIQDGEFIVLVGPSGCGKSTLLRMLAGLEDITSGDLLIDGRRVNEVDPKDRNLAMVFQNYALYPHLDVYHNMAFSLTLRKEKKAVIEERVQAAAKTLGLTKLLDRKPSELSGGQRQRVALGRAIVRKPQAFLMDEPLSNLDAKLRVQMRYEISRLHHDLGTTMIYVTHDQTEAMTMGDRLVVMNEGRVQQIGTPDDIYHTPANRFVAEFLGSPRINMLPGHLKSGRLQVFGSEHPGFTTDYDGDVQVGVRPENLALTAGTDYRVMVVENLGSEKFLYLARGEEELRLKVPHTQFAEVGEKVGVKILNPQVLNLFRKDNDKALPWLGEIEGSKRPSTFA